MVSPAWASAHLHCVCWWKPWWEVRLQPQKLTSVWGRPGEETRDQSQAHSVWGRATPSWISQVPTDARPGMRVWRGGRAHGLPFCSSEDWEKLCVAGPKPGQQGVIQSEINQNNEGLSSTKSQRWLLLGSHRTKEREARTCHPAETLQKWDHWPCTLKVWGSDLAFALYQSVTLNRSLSCTKSWVSLLLLGWLEGSSETTYMKVILLQLSKMNCLLLRPLPLIAGSCLRSRIPSRTLKSILTWKRNLMCSMGLLYMWSDLYVLCGSSPGQGLSQGLQVFASQAFWLFPCSVVNTGCHRPTPCQAEFSLPLWTPVG